jgi:crotonobetainyl-CoA:carnitine CoA-transferase CaiB-like acyl-CoA transferase
VTEGALSGVRVLDAGTLVAAPLACTFLAEFGADVIKVEPPDGGDPLRRWGMERAGVGLMWKSVGRNKKCITLNLRVPEGRDLFRSLVTRSDVLVVNFRPPTLKRWGLTYDDLGELHPGLVMLHMTAFGGCGPYAERPGFGTLIEAMSGFAHITGEPGGPPTLPPFMLADGVAALAGAYAVMFALYHRDARGGSGQLIDLAILEPLVRLLEHMVVEYDHSGSVPSRPGNRWGVTVPRNAYRTKDGHWVAMSGSAPTVALRALGAIGRSDLAANPDYSDPQKRLERADEIDAMFAEWIETHTRDEALELFEREGVAAAPVYDVAELMSDVHVKARDTFQRVLDPEVGALTVQAPAPRLSGTPGGVAHLGRPLGADNEEIFRRLLNVSEDAFEDLRAEGVL